MTNAGSAGQDFFSTLLEAALYVFCRRVGINPELKKTANGRISVFPFDPRRRRMSAIAGGRVHVKGAPDAVLPRCVNPEGADSALQEMAARGLRVIAVARRSIGTVGYQAGADEIEKDLELLGLLGIEDPPRHEAAGSIAACRRAGIKVAMVTGDHPATAQAIAIEVGLLAFEGRVIEGRDLPYDDTLLGALVDRDGVVLSRVTPEDKLRIARALRARGHVVAMTGDGVNDGPALQEPPSVWRWARAARMLRAKQRTLCCSMTTSLRLSPRCGRAVPRSRTLADFLPIT